MNLLYIFLGGGLGALSRYSLSSFVQTLAEHSRLHKFPVGIMVCNLLGCFLIGLTFAWIGSQQDSPPVWLHPLAVSGFLGGFTTFSTFSLDSYNLMTESPALALSNILLSAAGGLIAVWLGFKCIPQ